MSALLAINWQPELRGILIVIISVTVLCGSLFMILSTNLGVRLGFLVALAGLFAWMFLMGAIWWSYGKGLLGKDPSWKPVPAAGILQTPQALTDSGPLNGPITVPADATPAETADAIMAGLQANGWKSLDAALPSYQQAGAAAVVMLEENGVFKAGESQIVHVYDKGGKRGPNLFEGKVDFLAFLHKPHYSLVEVAPLVAQRAEAGRAPAAPVIDSTLPHQYVYMIRDLGNKRVPAAMITISSLAIFLVLCWLLHRRDRVVALNRAATALPAKV